MATLPAALGPRMLVEIGMNVLVPAIPASVNGIPLIVFGSVYQRARDGTTGGA